MQIDDWGVPYSSSFSCDMSVFCGGLGSVLSCGVCGGREIIELLEGLKDLRETCGTLLGSKCLGGSPWLNLFKLPIRSYFAWLEVFSLE